MWSYYLVDNKGTHINLIKFRTITNMMLFCGAYGENFTQYIQIPWFGSSTVKNLPDLKDPAVRKWYGI